MPWVDYGVSEHVLIACSGSMIQGQTDDALRTTQGEGTKETIKQKSSL